jgi:hypothetical protein
LKTEGQITDEMKSGLAKAEDLQKSQKLSSFQGAVDRFLRAPLSSEDTDLVGKAMLRRSDESSIANRKLCKMSPCQIIDLDRKTTAAMINSENISSEKRAQIMAEVCSCSLGADPKFSSTSTGKLAGAVVLAASIGCVTPALSLFSCPVAAIGIKAMIAPGLYDAAFQITEAKQQALKEELRRRTLVLDRGGKPNTVTARDEKSLVGKPFDLPAQTLSEIKRSIVAVNGTQLEAIGQVVSVGMGGVPAIGIGTKTKIIGEIVKDKFPNLFSQ